jgi:hypothetical protein
MPTKLQICVAIFFLAVICTSPTKLAAQIPSYGIDTFQPPADLHWATIAVHDVEGAYKLLKDNHPGAAPSLHDVTFEQTLAKAYLLALSRARSVSSYEGYIATLAGFATDMGDKHIWSRPTFVVAYPRWAGLIISKRGADWIVTDTDMPYIELIGASLVSCDGVPVTELARKNLGGFRADWSVGAQQTQSAPWLLIDEANPFISRPNSCVFDHNGKSDNIILRWERIRRENLLPRLKTAIGAGAAGYGVRQVASGYWIGLQDLSSAKANDVTTNVEEQKSALRQSAFVVLDLRGNGGGSSELGRQIAVSLMGRPAVDGRLSPESGSNCGGPDGAWRTSEGNINNMQYLLTTVLAGGAEVQRIFSVLLRDAREARAQGEEFSGPINCPPPSQPVPASQQPPSQMKGLLLLLTDNLCFSSCLAVTDDFRQLGAFHIGQTTDAATHFTEVREQYMPSGYSVFSTLQSVTDPSGPPRVGPYEPALTYNGDVADTAALETWVLSTAVPRAEQERSSNSAHPCRINSCAGNDLKAGPKKE